MEINNNNNNILTVKGNIGLDTHYGGHNHRYSDYVHNNHNTPIQYGTPSVL